MKIAKVAIRSIWRNQKDSKIYMFTLVSFSMLLLSAFMLDAFPIFTQLDSGIYFANSLPWMVVLTLLCLMLYMNRFMLKQRGQELGVYLLSGASTNAVCKMYVIEYALMGFLAFLFGIIFGLFLFGCIFALLGGQLDVSFLISAVAKSFCYYSIAFIVSLFSTVVTIKRLTLKRLLEHKQHNDRRKCTIKKMTTFSIITVLAYGVFIYQITHLTPYTVSTLVFSVSVILYGSYTTVLGWLQLYRELKGHMLYKNVRLFIVGQSLSGIKTLPRISSIISGCLLISIISAIAGSVFLSDNGYVFLGQGIDTVMGFSQIYIAVLFTIVVFSVVALRQIIDVQEHKQKYVAIKRLGIDHITLNRILLWQIVINFTIPVFMAVILAILGLLILAKQWSVFLSMNNIMATGFIQYMGIFLVLYCCYIYVTYISLKSKFAV